MRQQLVIELEQTFSPTRGSVWHDLWLVERALGMHADYFSQSGQDRYVNEVLLEGRTSGVFLEIGGFDGITGSNSLFFEKNLDWTGLLAEAAPEPFSKAKEIRQCTCLHCAVGKPEPEVDFMEIRSGLLQCSGLLPSFDQTVLERVRQHPDHEENICKIPVRSIGDILEETGIDRIDYFSLDVEGGELAVLQSFPFETVSVEVWSIENYSDSSEVPRFMAGKGFEVVEFIGLDEIYRAA